MRRLYLHIGMMKTGTTSLQSFCWRNRGWLARHGFLYPLIWGTDSHRFWGRRVVRHPIGSDMFASSVPYWERHVLPKLRRQPDLDVIVSYEGLWLAGCQLGTDRRTEVLRECLRGFVVHVVAYLRRQDEWYESLYNERVKAASESRSLHAFIRDVEAEHWGDAPLNLGFWRDLVGKENVHVRAYERGQLRGDITSDFMEVLGVTDLTGTAAPASGNPRLSSELVAPMRALNRLSGALPVQLVGRAMASAVQRFVPEDSTKLLTRQEAIEIHERYRAGNAAVAREYLGREDGRLFRKRPEDEKDWPVNARARA